MEVDPAKVYLAPLIMGPLFDRADRPPLVYGETQSISLTFRTDADAVRPLVPDCFSIPDQPTATVSVGDWKRVDFMAGGGYRVAYVGVSARFEGEETAAGLCVLIMWENDTVPIVSGRDLIGIPKLHADITSIRQSGDGSLRATAAVWGHEVLRLEVRGLKEQNALVRRTAQKRVNETPWLGYKHVPSFDGPPDASYPMVVWNDANIEGLWLGEGGSVSFGTASEDDLGYLAGILESLRTIPVGEVLFAVQARGSGALRLDRSHRLR